MAKKKSGQNPVNNIKTSKFLPSVFQTELNKSWLDSTMDQMVSKGPLEDINGFVGSRDGLVANATDTYIEPKFRKNIRTENELTPAIVSYNKNKDITKMLAFDDIAHAIDNNFSTYNYNSAYSSSRYSYSPPIDFDKFVNYINYHWVEELPIYESIWTGAIKNPITDIEINGWPTILDDNNEFTVENQMLIKFKGAGWHADVLNKTFIIAGTVNNFKLYEYLDASGNRVYNNTVKHSENTDGTYVNNTVLRVEPNTNSAYWVAGRTPAEVVQAYNQNVDRLPVFDGFKFTDKDTHSDSLTGYTLIKFTTGWGAGTDLVEPYSVQYTIAPNPEVVLTEGTDDEKAKVTGSYITPNNNLMYDSGHPVVPLKDYITIAKNDPPQTAWSRSNHWVNRSTISKLATLMPYYDFSEIRDIKRRAHRPIIEYNPGLHLWNQSENVTSAEYKGVIDEAVTTGNEPTTTGKTYVYIDDTDDLIHTVGGSNSSLIEGDTFSVLESTNSLWVEADGYFTNGKVELAQQKTKTNQYPLYRFYNTQGTPLESINGKRFVGDRIFGFKEGTGANDPELGFALCYKDSPKGAEYEFENFIITGNYYTTYANAENSRGTFSKDQKGYNLFKQDDVLKTVYVPAGELSGALEHKQYNVESTDTDLVIPLGYNNWRPTQEYIIHKDNNKTAITISSKDGSNFALSQPNELYKIGTSSQIIFQDLTDSTITIMSHGVNIETNTIPEITITRPGTNIAIQTSSTSNNKHFSILINGEVLQSFIVTDKWDDSFYNVTLNGEAIAYSKITTTATSITIDKSIFTADDLVDIYWRNNDSLNETNNTSMPDVHKHNSENKAITTFTISETMDHWKSKLNATPGFDGKTYGENNFASIPRTSCYGGTIFMHEDTSIMHDITYVDNELSITGALLEQAKEFIAFRTRVSAQARRVYATTGVLNVQDLANKAVNEVTRNQRDHGLYKESNMLSIDMENTQKWILEEDNISDFSKTFQTRFIFNGDTNIRDHVYVYLTEAIKEVTEYSNLIPGETYTIVTPGNVDWTLLGSANNNAGTVFVATNRTSQSGKSGTAKQDGQQRRLLVKDTEYTFIGDTVTLTLDYAAFDSLKTQPQVEVFYIDMDDDYFIPPSMVKLGLGYGTQPQVNDNILYTHDGTQFDVTNSELLNVNAPNFDPVNAVIYEIEKRIYAGLVKQDKMYNDIVIEKYKSHIDYLPSQHKPTWYSLADYNNYLEKYYSNWATENNITSLNLSNYYDAADPFTWNYSSIVIADGFLSSLPGHWKGAYTYLFGTCTPHITPWHMLGYAFKPTWWDTHYSWKAGAKRTALLDALKKGIISEPGKPVTQSVKYARYYWPFSTTNKCPVTDTGTLELPHLVLGIPTDIEKAKEFVFGDWGPVEFNWRSTAIGQSIMVDGVLKLHPAKAWTDFFQPGIFRKNNTGIHNINQYNDMLPGNNMCYYKTPGKVYDSVIDSITVKNSPTTLESDGYFTMLDDDYSTFGKAVYSLNSDNKITALSMTDRGLSFTSQHIISYVGTTGLAANIDLDARLKSIPFVANGISQSQYNYMIRNSFGVDLDDLYNTLATKLQFKLSGFSNKHLLNISSETSLTGDFVLGDDDFDIKMYKGATTDLVAASTVTITKTSSGYKVAGVSNNAREFKFYEPNVVSSTDYTTRNIASQTVRRYNKFVTTPSVVEYDSEFQRLQDVYNFIRGYWKWMETSGYKLTYDGDSSATDFVGWALTAKEGEGYILQIGREISFTPDHGHVYEYNQLEYNSNNILLQNGKKIENSDLGIKRIDGTVSVETKDKSFIGSITSAILDYEHIIIFENKTKLGVTIFDDTKNNGPVRLLVTGQRTQNWTGEKKAPGYLIMGDYIVQNFDSAVESIDNLYRTDVDHFNKSFSKAKDLTIGNAEGQLLSNLGINENVLTNYHQGVIKEKGTRGAVEHVGKSNILDNGETTVSAFEEYMFRQSTLGNDDFEDPLEIEIVSGDIISSPQTISLNTSNTEANVIIATDNKIVNNKSITFDTVDYANADNDILTGGELLRNESDYQVLNSSYLSDVFDSTAEYANIPTWNNTTSYKKGDKVRYQGELWQCSVDFTGLTEVTDIIQETGLTTSPTFPYGTKVNLAGMPEFELQNQVTVYPDIVATGSSFTAFTDSESLTINGESIIFDKDEYVTSVTGPARLIADSGPAELNPVTNKNITFVVRNTTLDANNNTVTTDTEYPIDFDTTPGEITESFNGDTTTTSFTISQALTSGGFFINGIDVDGVAQAEPADYSQTGQTVTFTSAPGTGTSNIVVTLAHTPLTMNASEIKSHIDAYNISGLTVNTTSIVNGIVTQSMEFVYQDADPENSITLKDNPDNADLGYPTTGNLVEGQETSNALVPQPLTVADVVTQINNTSATNLVSITASESSGNLVLTKTNNTSNNKTLVLGGSTNILTYLGLPGDTATPGTYTSVGVSTPTTMDATGAKNAIATELVNNGITEVTISVFGQAIRITSTGSSLTMGDTDFNSIAGLQTGTITSSDVNVANVWNPAQFGTTPINNEDPAIYNIQITDDSDFEIESRETVTTKFYGWNVLQTTLRKSSVAHVDTDTGLSLPLVIGKDYRISSVGTTDFTSLGASVNTVLTRFTATGTTVSGTGTVTQIIDTPLYTKSSDGSDCGICAGRSSKDGNDAEVTTNEPHGLSVGDYVQLLNTTTTPTIDGIHKVTKLGSTNKVFYIDEYIEACGNAVSVMPLVTTRFLNTPQVDEAALTAHWNLPINTMLFVNDKNGVQGTYVYGWKVLTGTNEVGKGLVRQTLQRPTNKDIDSIVIYNHAENKAKVQLEVWDPMRKILPGIAQKNIDYNNFNDNAIYNTSTDTTQLLDKDAAWGPEQVGTRWWDISKVRYYDYDQGDSFYKSALWGQLYPGSEIAVWEWIKSNVAPDDYAEAVKLGKEIFGTVATGVAYSIYDQVAKETQYYYTTIEEWNTQTSSYDTVYYYWVKNKTTISDDRSLSAYDVENIIKDPTGSGVSWFAVISDKEFIIDNINYYVEDKNTVLQINKAGDKFKSHNEWTVIAQDSDTIPEYYINGMKMNFGGRDANSNKIPYQTLHKFNKYGDDLSIGQSWFNDITDARRNAIITINMLLKNINLIGEYLGKWDDTLVAHNFPSNLWKYTDYKSASYSGTLNHTRFITAYSDLDSIDLDYHHVVKMTVFNDALQLNTSETYAYNTDTNLWELVFKKNGTIAFDEKLLTTTGGWDAISFDSGLYDAADIAGYWEIIIEALHKDIFVSYNTDKMNTFFFSVIHYILSTFEQTNWIRKTTYIKLEFTNTLDTVTRKYTRNKINNVLGYIQEIKPYHTKASTVVMRNTTIDEVGLTLTESPTTKIIMKPFDIDTEFGYPSVTIQGESEWNETATTTYDGGGFTTDHANTDTVSGIGFGNTEISNPITQTFTGDGTANTFTLTQDVNVGVTYEIDITINNILQSTDTWSIAGQVITFVTAPLNNDSVVAKLSPKVDPAYFNYTNEGHNRNSLVEVRPLELLRINVQTNVSGSTHASTSRTFAHIRNVNGTVSAYALTEAKETTIATTPLALDSTTITVASTTAFDNVGIAYVNGELIEYSVVDSTTLGITKRELAGTFKVLASVGDSITQVDKTQLTFANIKQVERVHRDVGTVNEYTGIVDANDYQYNKLSDTILNSPGSTQAQELQTFGKGIEL